jgi:hypothetical protein
MHRLLPDLEQSYGHGGTNSIPGLDTRHESVIVLPSSGRMSSVPSALKVACELAEI